MIGIGLMPIKPQTHRKTAIGLIEAIEHAAREHERALFVILGSHGNKGTQESFARIASMASEVRDLLEKPAAEFDKERWPFDRETENE